MLYQNYYTCEVKLYNDKNYTTSIKLSDLIYKLDFHYNYFDGCYHLTVYDSADRVLAANKKIDPKRSFVFDTFDADQLGFSFSKIYDYRDVNYDKWNENMVCVAYLTRWESQEIT